MGSFVFDGVDDIANYLVDSPVGSLPLTLACWFKDELSADDGVTVSLADPTHAAKYFNVRVAGSLSGDPIQADARHTTIRKASTTLGFTPGVWQSAVAVSPDENLRSAYLDGGNRGDNAASAGSSDVFTAIQLGSIGDSTPSNYFRGKLAYVFVWSVALSDAEVADWHSGNIPQLANLQAWYDLTVSPTAGQILDKVGTRHLTLDGPTFDSLDTPSVSYGGGGSTPVELAASLASSSDVAAALRVTRTLETILASDSDLSASIQGAVQIDASLDSVSDLGADLRVTRTLEGELGSVGGAGGELTMTRALAGELGSTSSLAVAVTKINALQAQLDSDSDLITKLVVTHKLAAIIASEAWTVGKLTVGIAEPILERFRTLIGMGR